MPVLVAYASKFGSTDEIAERIASILKAEGLTVSLEPAGAVLDPSDYDAIILGGDVVGFRWSESSPLLRRGKAPERASQITSRAATGHLGRRHHRRHFVVAPGTQGL